MRRRAMFIMLIVGIIGSCKPGQGQNEKEAGMLYYYPEKNVYYDVEKNSFWYTLNGGVTWISFTGDANKSTEYLGKRVVLRSNNAEVFKENETHRKSYGGVLLNIRGEDSSQPSQAEEASERKVAERQKPTVNSKPVNKDKKGLGKFFRKIFGKKK